MTTLPKPAKGEMPLGKLEDTMFENIATKIKDRIHN